MKSLNLLNNYNNLKYDLKFLEKAYKDFEKIKEKAFRTAYKDSNVSRFWNLTRLLSETPLKWNSLLRKLGYTHFYDPGKGIIHRSEPTQIVVFDPRIIIPIETFLNPYNKKEREKVIKSENISEKDINELLKTRKNIKFDKDILNNLKPYQLIYIINNNVFDKKDIFKN